MNSTFEYGRAQAQQAVSNLQDCQIDSSVTLTPNLKQWLKTNRFALAQDIALSPHNWNVGNYQECAYTQAYLRGSVELSLPVCANVASQASQAAQILFQQSLTHYAITDLGQILALKQFVFATPQQSCNPPGSVWDPAICGGHEITLEEKRLYFQPGETLRKVGSHGYQIRMRQCTRQTGCADWFVPTSASCIDSGGNLTSCSGHPLLMTTNATGISGIIYGTGYGVQYMRVQLNNNTYYTSNMNTNMSIKTTCAYGKITGEMEISSNSGSYYNYEMVLYGTH
jgi:hypothetical protein